MAFRERPFGKAQAVLAVGMTGVLVGGSSRPICVPARFAPSGLPSAQPRDHRITQRSNSFAPELAVSPGNGRRCP